MVDIELEVIDLPTEELIATFELNICESKFYELDTGNYRFRAKLLATNEVQETEVTITEGVNPSLEFTFQQTPPEYTLNINAEREDETPIQGVPIDIKEVS